MSNFNNLWNNWYSKKVLTEMKAITAKRVVAVAQSIKEKAGLEGLNDSYIRMAAFPEMFGDKLRIVVDAAEDDLLVMAKYVDELEKLALQSLKDKVAKGFIKDDSMTYSVYFGHEQLLSKETKRRLQEDGGGTYEIEVIYHQPILVIEYINMQGQRKKENTSLLKAFNKFKMREAADYWANIQSRYTKDKQFIVYAIFLCGLASCARQVRDGDFESIVFQEDVPESEYNRHLVNRASLREREREREREATERELHRREGMVTA
jgi:hypothetical protein